MLQKKEAINNFDVDYSFKNNKLEYVLTYSSFGIINPTFQQYEILPILLLSFLIFYFFISEKKIDRILIYLGTTLLILLIAQAFKFGNFSLRSFFGVLMIWLIPYLIIRIVKFRFINLYINTLFFFSLIGLFFWLIINISPDIHNALFQFVELIKTDPQSGESFIIYNLDHSRETDLYFIRNPGPFNEGGVFSCYLILGLILNTIIKKRIWNIKSLVFIISILTTSSTAGYVSLFLFFIVYFLVNKKILLKITLLPLSIIISYYAYNNLPFLEEKITQQFEEQTDRSLSYGIREGRFYSVRIGLLIIYDNPIFGKGLYKKDRFYSEKEEKLGITGGTNGIIELATRYGIIFTFIYFYFFYHTFRNIVIQNAFLKNFAIWGMIPILAVVMAQNPFWSPVFIIITIHYFYYKYPLKSKIIR